MWCHAKRITCDCVRPICGYGIFEFQFVNDDGLPHAGLLDSLDISSAYEVRLMKSDGISCSIGSLSSLSILITAVIYHLRLSPLVQCQRAYTITRGRLQYQLIFYNKCIWTGQSGQTPFRKCIPLFAYRPSVVCQTIIKTNILNDASTEFEYLISRAFFIFVSLDLGRYASN